MEDRRVEALAEYAHQAWSGWMDYLFSKSWETNHDDFRRPEAGSVTIPRELAKRWQRQMNTPYADLPDDEKESDREEARRMLRIMEDR